MSEYSFHRFDIRRPQPDRGGLSPENRDEDALTPAPPTDLANQALAEMQNLLHPRAAEVLSQPSNYLAVRQWLFWRLRELGIRSANGVSLQPYVRPCNKWGYGFQKVAVVALQDGRPLAFSGETAHPNLYIAAPGMMGEEGKYVPMDFRIRQRQSVLVEALSFFGFPIEAVPPETPPRQPQVLEKTRTLRACAGRERIRMAIEVSPRRLNGASSQEPLSGMPNQGIAVCQSFRYAEAA